MSTDARNSLIAWGAALACFGLMWLDSRYPVTRALPPMPRWVDWAYYGVLAIVGIVGVFRSLRRWRRAKISG